MKKILVLLVVVCSLGTLTAQTFSETHNRVSKEISQLQTTLEGVKDKIYYLEVTLNERIKADSVHHFTSRLTELRKERRFAAEDLVSLKKQKKMIEESISKLEEALLSVTESQAKTDLKNNLPERMTQYEYTQRVRSQIFRMSEDGSGAKLFRGLLINDKIGVSEKANFVISNRNVKDTPLSFTLDPQSKKEVFLPVGEYIMEIYCGSYYSSDIFHVDPRKFHFIGNEDVYFGAEKFMSDK